jgi:hypothetical protein
VADAPPTLPPPDAEPRLSRRKALTKSFVARAAENLWLKVTSVGLAVLLWYGIVQQEPTSTLVPVRLLLQLDSSLALRAEPSEIYAIVQGTPSELSRLDGRTATINRSINSNTPDTLIITLNRTDVVLPANVDARVTEIRPRSVRLEFVRPLTRRVVVRSQVQIIGADAANPVYVEIQPDRVEVTGPRQSVLQVGFVRTDTASIFATDSIPHQIAIDTTGLGVLTVKPDQVRIRLVRRPPT